MWTRISEYLPPKKCFKLHQKQRNGGNYFVVTFKMKLSLRCNPDYTHKAHRFVDPIINLIHFTGKIIQNSSFLLISPNELLPQVDRLLLLQFFRCHPGTRARAVTGARPHLRPDRAASSARRTRFYTDTEARARMEGRTCQKARGTFFFF